MEYAMLSTLIPEEQAEFFKKNSKNVMQDAASVLQWNLYNGFCDNLNQKFPLINVLPVGSFPQYYKRPFVSASEFNENGKNIGFCNVKLLRNYHKSKKIYKELLKWCSSKESEKTLFVYTISPVFLKPVSRIKKKYPDLKVCAIVADLPNMSNLSAKRGILQKLYLNKSSAQAYDLLSCVDSFVLLTKYMADYMHINQPYCVMEGVASAKSVSDTEMPKERECKNIVYTGTLHRKFGILHLLEAFHSVPNQDVKLVICGIGDSEAEIRKAAQEDKRIDFRGQQSRADVLDLQKNATVLVNPRLNNEEFTKYSFPSKTMEYLASGVPVIAYKLDGIPDEYDKYLNYPKDDSVAALKDAIVKICELDDETRNEIGNSGRDYVLTNKNPFVQTKKILDFLSTQK